MKWISVCTTSWHPPSVLSITQDVFSRILNPMFLTWSPVIASETRALWLSTRLDFSEICATTCSTTVSHRSFSQYRFAQTEEVTEWNHNIKLKASRLLEWREWNRQSREYLVSFGDSDGPALRDDVVVYVSAMQELFSWLFSQRVPINTDPRVRKRFRVQSD